MFEMKEVNTGVNWAQVKQKNKKNKKNPKNKKISPRINFLYFSRKKFLHFEMTANEAVK